MAAIILDPNPSLNHILTTLQSALHEGQRSGFGHVHLPAAIPIHANRPAGKFFAVFAEEMDLGKMGQKP